MSKPQFVIKKSEKNARWYWTLASGNYEPILRTSESDGFADVEEAKTAITATRDAVKQHKSGKQTIERFNGTDHDPHDFSLYFRVVNEDGDRLAVSESYKSNGARAKGIDSVLENAPIADITIIS